MTGFRFTDAFVSETLTFLGNPSLRFKEALHDGDFEFVRTFLLAKIAEVEQQEISGSVPQVIEKADRQIRLRSLYTRCLAQKSIYNNSQIYG